MGDKLNIYGLNDCNLYFQLWFIIYQVLRLNFCSGVGC